MGILLFLWVTGSISRVAASEYQKMRSRSYPSTVSGSFFMEAGNETNIVEDVLTLRVLALYQQGLIVFARFMR